MQLNLPAKSVKSLDLEKHPSEESNSAYYRMPLANLSLKEHEKNFRIQISFQCRELTCERLGNSNKSEI